MKRVGFIGAYDKTDLILYVARILVGMSKKVLVIDATILQKARYIVPAINTNKTYITEFEGIEVAVGFQNYQSIKEYLGIPLHAVLNYDYIFLDIDTGAMLQNFECMTNNKNYFVTGLDSYSLKRGLEIFSRVPEAIPIKKIMFSKKTSDEEDEYLNYLSSELKITWDEEKIYFPFEMGDQSVILDNQRVSKIKLKKLTDFYKTGLLNITRELLEDPREEGSLKRTFKILEKGA